MAIGLLYYKVQRVSADKSSLVEDSSPEIGAIDIFDSEAGIVTKYANAKRFTRIGIQAPPGTKVVLNKTHTIMIGRTGIYELEAEITHMYFIKPRIYEPDEEATLNALYDGAKAMYDAERLHRTDMTALPWSDSFPAAKEEWSSADREYWDKYIDGNGANIKGMETYTDAYSAGLSTYQKGTKTIYKLPNEEDVDAPENFVDVKNIVLDFIYSTT